MSLNALFPYTVAVATVTGSLLIRGIVWCDNVGSLSCYLCFIYLHVFFCYTCVKSTVYLGQQVYNFYTGLSLAVQTSVPNEFQSVRDFIYGVIVITEISSFPLSFSFTVFFSLSLF